LGRALSGKMVGEEVSLRLPTGARHLRIMELITVHQAEQAEAAAQEAAAQDEAGRKGTKSKRKAAEGNGKK